MVASVRLFDEVVDFLTSIHTPAQVVAYKPSAELQEQAERLLEKKRSGALTEDERQELDYLVVIEHLMRMAKARAFKRLAEA